MVHSFDAEEARMFGIEEAILLQYFRFWIIKNEANDRHLLPIPAHYNIKEDRYWTYNSAKAIAQMFQYMNEKKIYRALESLLKSGVLLKGNFNDMPYDRKLWYCFAHRDGHKKTMFEIQQSVTRKEKDHFPKTGNEKPENGEPIAVILTVSDTDISFSKEKGETADFEVKKSKQKTPKAARQKSEFKSVEVATQYDEVMARLHEAAGIGYEWVDWGAHGGTMQSLRKIDESCRKWAKERKPENPMYAECREFIFVSAFSYFHEIAKSKKDTLTITPEKVHRNFNAIKTHGVQRYNRNSPTAAVTAANAANAAVAVADGW